MMGEVVVIEIVALAFRGRWLVVEGSAEAMVGREETEGARRAEMELEDVRRGRREGRLGFGKTNDAGWERGLSGRGETGGEVEVGEDGAGEGEGKVVESREGFLERDGG